MEAVSTDEPHTGKPDDAFHFTTYLPVRGTLYELDGLAGGPIRHGECTESDWLAKVRPVIEERIQRYAGQEIRFNLMAVIKDIRAGCRQELAHIDAQLQSQPGDEGLLMRREDLLSTIAAEDAKMTRYAKENARRKHNFIGFIYELLQIMAERDLLPSKS